MLQLSTIFRIIDKFYKHDRHAKYTRKSKRNILYAIYQLLYVIPRGYLVPQQAIKMYVC